MAEYNPYPGTRVPTPQDLDIMAEELGIPFYNPATGLPVSTVTVVATLIALVHELTQRVKNLEAGVQPARIYFEGQEISGSSKE